MKKLYTTLAIAIAMLVAIPSQAQISWGVRAGANLVNMKMSGDVLVRPVSMSVRLLSSQYHW